jgi:hypothetical protein
MFSKLTVKPNTAALFFVSKEKSNCEDAICAMFADECQADTQIDNLWLNRFFVVDETPSQFSYGLLDLEEYKILHPTHGVCFLSFEINSGFEITD